MFPRCILHEVTLNAVDLAHFLHRRESPKASEILRGYYFQIQIYVPYYLQEVSMSE